MGYQEVFIKAKDNKSTRKLLKAMLREGVRAKGDYMANIICIGRAKVDLESSCGSFIGKNEELIVVTGDRMRSLGAYLSNDYKPPKYTFEEKRIIKKSDYIPLDNIAKLSEGYDLCVKDMEVEDFLKDINKSKRNKEKER